MTKIAFLGPKGTFSEEAAMLYDSTAELVPCGSNPAVVQAVLQGKADEAVVARENSIGGTVIDVVDPLLAAFIGIDIACASGAMSATTGTVVIQQGHLMLGGEIELPIHQCLYRKWGDTTPIRKVQVVYSHLQGLLQCQMFLQTHIPQAQLVPTSSTVAAIPEMLDSLKPALAIAPRRAGALFPVEMVQDGIEDDHSNTTRFVVISKKDKHPTGRDKTSIWFTVPGDEKPGTLVRVLQVFASVDFNMRLIESRPTKRALGQYVFLVDLDCHRTSHVFSDAVEFIVRAGFTTSFRILGSYPRWRGEN